MDALGNETKYEYHSEDHLVKMIDAIGYATIFALDATGKVLETVNQLNTTTATMQYDAVGNLLNVKDAIGVVVITTSYDTVSMPISVTDDLGRTVTKHYDSLYRLDQVVDAADRLPTTITL